MGIDFRGEGYVRRVRWGKRTVKQGEAAAVWDSYGRHKEVIGPALVRLWFATIRFLDKHVAGDDEYLRIREVNGTVKHVRGPAAIFENPVYHMKKGVTVKKAIKLENASQVCVVQRSTAPAGEAATASSTAKNWAQVVIPGPNKFYPEVTDEVRKFSWGEHATKCGLLLQDGFVINSAAGVIIPLSIDLRGADSHEATLGLELRVRLADVQKALATRDPIRACETVTSSAVLKEAATMQLYSLARGESSANDAKGAGNGSQASGLSAALQAKIKDPTIRKDLESALLEHAACELRSCEMTTLTLSPGLHDLLRREEELVATRLKEKIADEQLEAAAARQEKEHKLAASKQAHDLKMKAERDQADCTVDDMEARRDINYLKELRDLDVDVTKYLITRNAAKSGIAVPVTIEDEVVEPKNGCFACKPGKGARRVSKLL